MWVDIEDFGREREQWLSQFLELPNGISSHDTFARVFARFNPGELQTCFISFSQSLVSSDQGAFIPIDGKTLG